MPYKDLQLQKWLERYNALHENNRKHIEKAVRENNIIFYTAEQFEDFLSFCEKADILFQLGLAE